MGFELIAEQKIREAIDGGAFSALSGEGKPLQQADDALAGDNRMAFSVLRSNGFLPEWLELRKDIHAERDGVNAAMREWEDALTRSGASGDAVVRLCGERYRKAATAINAKIDLHNLRCPSILLEIVRFREDARPTNDQMRAGSSES